MNKISLRITNSTSNTLTLHLEPWGEQHRLVSGATFNLEAQGPDGGTMEVEYGENSLTVYGWTGSTISISEKRTE